MQNLPKTSIENLNEITVDHNQVSEWTYNAQSVCQDVRLLKAELYSRFPELIEEDTRSWDLIGKTKADNKNYFEDTISLTYQGTPNDLLLKTWRTSLGVSDCVDCYTIKYKLNSKSKVLKVYQKINKHYLLDLSFLRDFNFDFSVQLQLGLGRHFGDPQLHDLRDLYFISKDELKIKTDFGELFPVYSKSLFQNLNFQTHDSQFDYSQIPEMGLYGLCFNIKTMSFIKLKRYFYPSDWGLIYPERV